MMRIYVLQAFTVILIGITIASNLGKIHFALDTLSHFKVQYTVLFFLVSASFALLRQPAWLALSLVGIAANLAPIVPWYVAERQWLAEDSGRSIKILISNVYMGSKNYQKLLELVNDEQPDILGLMEVNGRWLDGLASLHNEYEFEFEYPQDDHRGLALFSKLPIAESNIVWFGDDSSPAIVANIVTDKDDFELILAHPQAPMTPRKAAIRNSQLQKIALHVRASDKTVVIAGDLNITMWSPHYSEFVKESGLLNARAGYGIGATWVSTSPFQIPIDHIMVSPPSRAGDFRVHRGIGSDHRPISSHVRIIHRGAGGMGGAAFAH